MDITGYAASILIGISLGLIGGGGSILTVPVLVYLFAVDAVLATTYSLFIVGSASLVGSFSYFKKGLIDVKTAFIFGIPSIVAVFLTRTYLLTAIPEHVFEIGSFTVSKRILLMIFFAVLMVLAAYGMIKKGDEEKTTDQKSASEFWVVLQGFAVGMVTGLIGAGGGFLIIPALVNLLKLPIKTAIGTSLIIIAVNSLTGFTFSFEQTQIEWSFLLTVTLIAIVGIFIGTYVSTKIEGKKLRPAFGYFVLAMGIYIIVKETLFK
ncbi:sulfite exporter TauE/SafE family protein [Pedobacter psychroterrae]|uniref:Probable membrane transporter protein n=1 Tax=Pedobacter psychroterrae TaxID=2530453 RepID=A0A4R0NR34_9SPHI|nr:sulfite exporter TauE/SafE family protein [Pedobacter psychroterrae]TCD01534.1 sulfite exporter TauE/SafE family protein [Pedobacter psychroterrae]